MNTASDIQTSARLHCYACGSPGHLLYEGLRDGLYSAPGVWSFRQCSRLACGLIWLDPVPARNESDRLYDSYYTHGMPGKYPNDGVAPLPERLRRGLGQLAIRTGVIRHRPINDDLLDHLRPGTRLLEIGCGRGDYLAQMRGRGWQVKGIDTDALACDFARRRHGLDVYCGDLTAAGLTAGDFDAIVMNHVVEHVHDPRQLLTECLRVLKPGGKLGLLTPNHQSLGHRVFREKWRGLEPPRHVFIFSPDILGSMAREAGFVDIQVSGTAQRSYHFFRGSLAASGNRISRTMQALLLQYYELIACRRSGSVGEEALLLCRKPDETGRAAGKGR